MYKCNFSSLEFFNKINVNHEHENYFTLLFEILL